MKQKQWYIVGTVVLAVLLLSLGTWLFLGQKKSAQTPAHVDETAQILTLSPDDIGLSIAFRSDNKAMKFTVGNASGITSIEYQISYTKDLKGQQVPEGLIGTVDMNPGDKTAGTGFREFGTCSSGVCRYDTVVSAIQLTLKVTKTDGKVYQVVKSVNLPQ